MVAAFIAFIVLLCIPLILDLMDMIQEKSLAVLEEKFAVDRQRVVDNRNATRESMQRNDESRRNSDQATRESKKHREAVESKEAVRRHENAKAKRLEYEVALAGARAGIIEAETEARRVEIQLGKQWASAPAGMKGGNNRG